VLTRSGGGQSEGYRRAKWAATSEKIDEVSKRGGKIVGSVHTGQFFGKGEAML